MPSLLALGLFVCAVAQAPAAAHADSTNASANASTAPTKATGTFSKWTGGVLVPATGKIYGIPCSADAVLVIDPAKGTVDSTSMRVPSGNFMWAFGVLAPATGKIYGIPCSADAVLVIDPVKGTADGTSMKVPLTGPVPSGGGMWGGGVLAPTTGKIYGMPVNAGAVLVIDPVKGTADGTSMTVPRGSGKWIGGVFSPATGKIYGMPFYADTVLVIDPVSEMVDTTSMQVPSGSAKWTDGVLAPTGKIYGIPNDADAVLVIDPVKRTVDTTSLKVPSGSHSSWFSGVLQPATGKIYGIPSKAGSEDAVLVIDPVQGTVDATSMVVPEGLGGWQGGVLVPATSKIYGIPNDADTVLVIGLNCSVDEPPKKATWGFVDVHVTCENETNTALVAAGVALSFVILLGVLTYRKYCCHGPKVGGEGDLRASLIEADDSSTLSTERSDSLRGVLVGPSVSIDPASPWSSRTPLVDQPTQAERNPPQAAGQSMAAAPGRAKARPVARALTSEIQPMAVVNMASWNPDPSGLLHASSSSSVDAEPRGLVAASASASVTAVQQPLKVPSASTTMAGWTRDTSALLSDTRAGTLHTRASPLSLQQPANLHSINASPMSLSVDSVLAKNPRHPGQIGPPMRPMQLANPSSAPSL